jgi:hypothetical protein
MGDQRFTAGQVRLSIGRFGFGNRCIGLGHDARVTLRQDQRMSGGKIRWQVPSGMRLEFGGGISGNMRLSFQAARSIG